MRKTPSWFYQSSFPTVHGRAAAEGIFLWAQILLNSVMSNIAALRECWMQSKATRAASSSKILSLNHEPSALSWFLSCFPSWSKTWDSVLFFLPEYLPQGVQLKTPDNPPCYIISMVNTKHYSGPENIMALTRLVFLAWLFSGIWSSKDLFSFSFSFFLFEVHESQNTLTFFHFFSFPSQ